MYIIAKIMPFFNFQIEILIIMFTTMYHKNHAKIQKKRKKIPPLFNIERFQQFK